MLQNSGRTETARWNANNTSVKSNEKTNDKKYFIEMVGEHFYAHLIAMFLNGLIILLLSSEFILETAPLAQSVECNRRHL